MKINLTTLKFTAKDELKEFVEEKISKLSRFNDKIISAEVILFSEDPKIPQNKFCEIRLIVPGYDDFVKKNGESFEEAILSAVDTMQNILQRKKLRA